MDEADAVPMTLGKGFPQRPESGRAEAWPERMLHP